MSTILRTWQFYVRWPKNWSEQCKRPASQSRIVPDGPKWHDSGANAVRKCLQWCTKHEFRQSSFLQICCSWARICKPEYSCSVTLTLHSVQALFEALKLRAMQGDILYSLNGQGISNLLWAFASLRTPCKVRPIPLQ